MAKTYYPEPVVGGDLAIWGPKEQRQNHVAIGLNTAKVYLDGGTLYLSDGQIGLNYSSSGYGIIINDAAASISVAALTASLWAKVELSQNAGTVVTEITSILGASDPATLPTWTYDPVKGGHYITATKRAVALVWINAAGAVEGIVNEIGGVDGYTGYSTSDDANDWIYEHTKINYSYAQKILNPTTVFDVSALFTVETSLRDKIYNITTAAGNFAGNIPAAANNKDVLLTLVKIDSGSGYCTITPNGAETFDGHTTIRLLQQWCKLTLKSDGTRWHVIRWPKPIIIDSAVLAVNQLQNLAHNLGERPTYIQWSLLCDSAEYNYSVGDEIFSWIQDAAARYWGVCADATNIITNTEAGSAMVVLDKTVAGTGRVITMNKWKIRIRCAVV